MYQGNRELRDRLLSMTPAEIRAYWAEEQRRKREAGQAHHTTLYAAATGPDADKIVARIDD